MKTARELILAWAVRDQLYTLRRQHGVRHPLDANEKDAIRYNREWEVKQLPPTEQVRAAAALRMWHAPEVAS